MTYRVVFRAAKIKTKGNLASAAHHIARTRETPNCDKTRSHLNEVLLGSSSPLADVEELLKKVNLPIRKDAVLAIEMILTANKEWFAQEDGNEQRFIDAFLPALRTRLKGQVAHIALHRDEEAAHMHILVVPLSWRSGPDGEKCGLNAHGMIGGRQKLSQWQDWVGKIGETIGLGRGLHREGLDKRRHMTPQGYRALLADANDQAAQVLEDARELHRRAWGAEDEASQKVRDASRSMEQALLHELALAKKHAQFDQELAQFDQKKAKLDKEVEEFNRDRELVERVSVAMRACLDRKIVGIENGKLVFKDKSQEEILGPTLGNCDVVLEFVQWIFEMLRQMFDAWRKDRQRAMLRTGEQPGVTITIEGSAQQIR